MRWPIRGIMSALIRNASSTSLCILVNGIITLRQFHVSGSWLLSWKICLIFQVKGCRGAQDTANHRALLGVFGRHRGRLVCAVLPSGLTGVLRTGGLLARGSLPEGGGLRVRQRRCWLLDLSIKKADMAARNRQATAGLGRSCPWSIELVMDTQPRAMPRGWKTSKKAPLWPEDGKQQGWRAAQRHIMSVDLTCHNSTWLLAGPALLKNLRKLPIQG